MGRTIVTEKDLRAQHSWRRDVGSEPTSAPLEQSPWDEPSHPPRHEPDHHTAATPQEERPWEEVLEKRSPEELKRLVMVAWEENERQARAYHEAVQRYGAHLEALRQDASEEPEYRGPPPTLDGYTDRLLKYIPAESVALYLTLQGIILSGAADLPTLNTWLWFILGIGLIGTALYQWRVLKIGKVVQLAVSTAAFVWVFALGGAFASLSWYEPFIGSLTLVIFTFFAPLISPDAMSTNQQ
jgi:hypothetical protein